jgi:hypothetical protein
MMIAILANNPVGEVPSSITLNDVDEASENGASSAEDP